MKDKVDINTELKFSQTVAKALDQTSEATDEATLNRLSEIRNRALRELDAKPSRAAGLKIRWLISGACAASVLAAVLVFFPSAGSPSDRSALSELELLASSEDIEMFEQDIEFYVWLEEQDNI